MNRIAIKNMMLTHIATPVTTYILIAVPPSPFSERAIGALTKQIIKRQA